MRYKRPMNGSRSYHFLALLSAAAKLAALLGLLLPWLTVAVGPHTVIRATGFDLAIGRIAARVPILGTLERSGGPVAIPLILAAILIAAGLGASLFAGRRRGARAGLFLSGLTLCLIVGFVAYSIYVHMPLPPDQMNLIERLADSFVRRVVHVRIGIGFWVTLAGLVAGMLLDRLVAADARTSQAGLRG